MLSRRNDSGVLQSVKGERGCPASRGRPAWCRSSDGDQKGRCCGNTFGFGSVGCGRRRAKERAWHGLQHSQNDLCRLFGLRLLLICVHWLKPRRSGFGATCAQRWIETKSGRIRAIGPSWHEQRVSFAYLGARGRRKGASHAASRIRYVVGFRGQSGHSIGFIFSSHPPQSLLGFGLDLETSSTSLQPPNLTTFRRRSRTAAADTNKSSTTSSPSLRATTTSFSTTRNPAKVPRTTAIASVSIRALVAPAAPVLTTAFPAVEHMADDTDLILLEVGINDEK